MSCFYGGDAHHYQNTIQKLETRVEELEALKNHAQWQADRIKELEAEVKRLKKICAGDYP